MADRKNQVDPGPIGHMAGRCWLPEENRDKRPRIKWVLRGNSRIEFDNLTEKEVNALEAALTIGSAYIRVVDGRLYAFHAFEDLPAPEEDPILSPHWAPAKDGGKLIGELPADGHYGPGLQISGVGAAGDADRTIGILTDWGFECCRSRRGPDGRYWEFWILHGLWAAKGALGAMVSEIRGRDPRPTWQEEISAAVEFIVRKHLSFGSLDVTMQRLGLVNPD